MVNELYFYLLTTFGSSSYIAIVSSISRVIDIYVIVYGVVEKSYPKGYGYSGRYMVWLVL